MDPTPDLAQMFKALGDPTRLRIFEFLRGTCCAVAVGEEGDVHPVAGPTVGEVCCHITGIDKVTSTISFHLKELRIAGLISMEKHGKYMVCAVNQSAIATLSNYLAPNEPKNCD